MCDQLQHGVESLHAIAGFTIQFWAMRIRVLVAGMAAMIAAPIAWQTLAARQATAVSLVITNGIVITVDGNRRILNPGSIAINGTDIVAVDTPANIAARYKAADTIDATGKVVMPGLINTHTHAAMVMYRGLGNDLALMDWLQKYIFPAEAKTVSPEFVRIGTRLALLEMIQSGTTTVSRTCITSKRKSRASRRPPACAACSARP